MERDIESTSTLISGGWRISTFVLRTTTIIFLAISLIILVSNVLRVPYGSDQVEIIHFYDVSGFIVMVSSIAIGIGYSIFQIVLDIYNMKKNRDRNFCCVIYGDRVISAMLASGAVGGILSTKEYHKWLREWLHDDAKEYENYFRKSYASAVVLLLAFASTYIISFIPCCVVYRKVSGLTIKSKINSAKVNAVDHD